MKICVIRQRETFYGTGRYHTSNGFLYSGTSISRFLVFIENENISIEQAFLILNFIKGHYYKSSWHSDEQYDRICEEIIELNLTNELIQILGDQNFILSDNYVNLVDALPICLEIIESSRQMMVMYIAQKHKNILDSAHRNIQFEREFLKNLLSLSRNLDQKIRLDSLEKITVNIELSKWKNELETLSSEYDKKIKIDIDNNSFAISGNKFDVYSLSFPLQKHIKEIDEWLYARNNLPTIPRDNSLNNGKWEIYPIDLAIYIEDIESLEALLKYGAKEFINKSAFIDLCIKGRSNFVFSSSLFPLSNLIENNLISLIVRIVVNDFSYGFIKVCESKKSNQELLAFAFCLSVDNNSPNIYNYILDQIDPHSYLIKIDKYPTTHVIGNTRILKKDLPHHYMLLGSKRFSFITRNDFFEMDQYKYIYTPLQYVCRYGNKAMVQSLLNKNVAINAKCYNYTALDCLLTDDEFRRTLERDVFQKNRDEIRSLLLENGAISAKMKTEK